MITDALSALSNNQARLLLKTDFRSAVTLGAVQKLGPAGAYTQARLYPSGADSAYGNAIDTALNSYFGSQCQLFIQDIPPGTFTDDADIALNYTTQIQATTISSDPNARELLLKLIKRNGAGQPQSDLQALRLRDDWTTTNVIPFPDLPSLYWKMDCILDPNLTNILADDAVPDAGYFGGLGAIKGGQIGNPYPSGSVSSSVGSWRFSTLIQKNPSGQLYVACMYDNVANGIGVIPTGANPQAGFYFAPFTASTKQISLGDTVKGGSSGVTGTIGFVDLRANTWTGGSGKGVVVITGANGAFQDGEKLQVQIAGVWTNACTVAKFWSGYESQQLSVKEQKYLYNAGGAGKIVLDTPLRFEYYIKRPIGGRTDLTTGITQVVMTNLSTGERTTLCDFRGGIQAGALNDTMARIFFALAYTNLNYSAYPGDPSINAAHKITNLEVWTDAPYQLV